MRKGLWWVVMMVAPAAWAQSTQARSAAGPGYFEQYQATRADSISNALGLDASGKAKVKATLDSYAAKGKGLHQQMRTSYQTLEQAAQGDTAALGQVDSAVQQLASLREQQEKLHQQLFNTLAQGLSPQQKAKLALALVPPPRAQPAASVSARRPTSSP